MVTRLTGQAGSHLGDGWRCCAAQLRGLAGAILLARLVAAVAAAGRGGGRAAARGSRGVQDDGLRSDRVLAGQCSALLAPPRCVQRQTFPAAPATITTALCILHMYCFEEDAQMIPCPAGLAEVKLSAWQVQKHGRCSQAAMCCDPWLVSEGHSAEAKAAHDSMLVRSGCIDFAKGGGDAPAALVKGGNRVEHTALLAEALQLTRNHDLIRPRVLPAQTVPRVELLFPARRQISEGQSARDGEAGTLRASEATESLRGFITHLVAARAFVASFHLRGI